MDWNLKSLSWDLGVTQFDRESGSDNNLVNGSSSLVDLKLGSVSATYSSDIVSKGKLKAEEMPGGLALSAGSSSKRARGGSYNNGSTQMVSCYVDGCVSDLRNCREYHRRHKVCEVHSKTPEVTIGGHKQRFCQQCSRFHSLEEFDEGKRSCRKRLDDHNRRRRKAPPEVVLQLPDHMSSDSSYSISNDTRSPFSKWRENPMFINNNLASSQNGATSSDHRWMFNNAMTARDLDCALSLLSSRPPPPPPPPPPLPAPMQQQLVPAQNYFNSSAHENSLLTLTSNGQCHGFFHMNHDDDESRRNHYYFP